MVFAEMVTNTIIFLAKLSPERFTKFWTSFDFSWFSGHDTPLFFLFFENLKTFVYIFSKFKNSWNWELWNRHPKANRQNRWRLIRKVRQLLFDCQFRIPKLRHLVYLAVFEQSSDVRILSLNRGKKQGNSNRFFNPLKVIRTVSYLTF